MDWGKAADIVIGSTSLERKLLFITVLVFAILTAIFCNDLSEIDVQVFHQYAVNIHDGMVPYRDFVVEFPPFALLFFYIPSLVSLDLGIYCTAFAVQVIVFSILTYRIGMMLIPDSDRMKIIYTVSFVIVTVSYIKSMIWKFDMFPVFFVILGTVLFTKRRYGPAYAVLTLASLIKIYPAIILALFLIINLFDRTDDYRRRHILIGIVASAAVCVAATAPFLIAGASPEQLLVWVKFHSGRGFQIESTVAIIVQLLGDLGIGSYELVEMYDTFDVVSPVTDALVDIWMPIVGLLLSFVYLVVIGGIRRHGYHSSETDVVTFVTLASASLILMFMITNKVFSTQYILWLLPMVFIFASHMGEKDAMAMGVLLLVIFCMSSIRPTEFPLVFHSVFIVRDILMIALLVLMCQCIAGRRSTLLDKGSDS